MTWISESDVGPGDQWYAELTKALRNTHFMIMCVTKQSLGSPWIYHEAGIARILQKNKICPYLIDLPTSAIDGGPLAHFQAAQANREQTRKLLLSVNRELGDEKIPNDRLETGFDSFWDAFEAVLNSKPFDPAGPQEFWYPHFNNGARNVVVHSEPVFFRVFVRDGDRQHRFFIRDVDINDSRNPMSDDGKKDLVEKLPWLRALSGESTITVSRGYIPGGEVFAKDLLGDWLRGFAEELVQHNIIGTVPKRCEQISHKAQWHDGPLPLENDNLILLGNLRSNPRFQDLLDDSYTSFRYRLEPRGIRIAGIKPIERDALYKHKFQLNDGRESGTQIIEDWDKESIVLVTRGPNYNGSGIATFILANQGRGVQAVVKDVLTSDRGWSGLRNKFKPFGLVHRELPLNFQMLFHVKLSAGEHESRTLGSTPVLYDGFD